MCIIDCLFDLLNSQNPFAKGYKAPLRPSNECFWRPFLQQARTYLLSLRDDKDQPMYLNKRRTAFVGVACAVDAVHLLYDELIAGENAQPKYLLTYKLSQYHSEQFLCAVRSSLRSSNNPTVRQFTAA